MQTVWIEIRTDRTVVLVGIKTNKHSDSVPENFTFENKKFILKKNSQQATTKTLWINTHNATVYKAVLVAMTVLVTIVLTNTLVLQCNL